MSGRHSNKPDDGDYDEFADGEQVGQPGVDRAELIPRPAPEGMSRKDRKLWRVLEAERIAAAVDRMRPSDGYGAIKPARIARRARFGLGVKGRRTFRDADFAYRSERWDRQQARADQDTKARGVLVLTVLLLAFLVWRLVPWGGSDNATPVSPAVGSSAAGTTRSAPTNATAPTPASSTPVAPSATPPSTVVSTASESAVFGNGTNTVPSTAVTVGSEAQTAPGVIGSRPLSSAPSVSAAPTDAVPASAQRTAIGAGQAWFERICGSSWRQPFGSVVTANKAAMTARGWAYANPASDTAGQRWWASVVQRKETRRCTHVTVDKFTGPGPTGPSVATLIFQADRVVTSDFPDVPAQLEKVSELRTVTRGTDGLWRVGAPELAG